MTVWYRYKDSLEADFCDFPFEEAEAKVVVRLHKYYVTKHTAKGVWLDQYRFVLNNARKRYACPTTEEAKVSFVARKRKQLKIYTSGMKRAEAALAKGLELLRTQPDNRGRTAA